jgi:hypothetical protein
MWVVVALVAALAPKRFDLARLLDGVLRLPKQIGGVHRDDCIFLTENGCVGPCIY